MMQYINIILQNDYYKKYQLLLLPAVAVLVAALLTVLVIIPQFSKTLEKNRLVAETNQKFSNIKSKVSVLEKINAVAYKNNINTSLIALPTDQDVPSALGVIIFLLNSNQLQLNNINVGSQGFDQPGTGGLNNYTIRVETTGNSNSLKNFISKLKESPRIMKVTGLEITPQRNTDKVSVNVTLQVYFQNLPTSIGDIEEPISEPLPEQSELLQKIDAYSRNVPVGFSAGSGSKGKSDPFQ